MSLTLYGRATFEHSDGGLTHIGLAFIDPDRPEDTLNYLERDGLQLGTLHLPGGHAAVIVIGWQFGAVIDLARHLDLARLLFGKMAEEKILESIQQQKSSEYFTVELDETRLGGHAAVIADTVLGE